MDGKVQTIKVIVHNKESSPLGDYVINFLRDHTTETPYLDYKLIIDTGKKSDFPEIVKDILAFSNYGGGWILIGWKEQSNRFYPVGLPEDYHIDQATLQEKFNSYVDDPLEIQYKEDIVNVNSVNKRFAYIYVPPSRKVLVPKKEGTYEKNGKTRTVFEIGEIFYRRGTQSIPPSSYEKEVMQKRIEILDYQTSILSGEPDKIEEEIYSNLFQIKKIPQNVFVGESRLKEDVAITQYLNEKGIWPPFHNKFKRWNGKIVTFENVDDPQNPYAGLISGKASKESSQNWLDDLDKSKVFVELLSREILFMAINKGLYYNRYKSQIYYPSNRDVREEKWPGRYSSATRKVVSKMYANQLKKHIFCHAACEVNILRIKDKFFLQLTPTIILTEDGKKTLRGPIEGTIITRLSYRRYNNIYLNAILFWIHKLGEGNNIKIGDYIEIDNKSSSATIPYGILFDIPSSEFRLQIEDEAEEEVTADEL